MADNVEKEIQRLSESLLHPREHPVDEPISAVKPAHFENTDDQRKKLENWLKKKPATFSAGLRQTFYSLVFSFLFCFALLVGIIVLNISYLIPMTAHYAEIAKAANEEAEKRYQIERSSMQLLQEIQKLEKANQVALSQLPTQPQAMKQLQHIIRLLEMSETAFLKIEKEVTENAMDERETSAIHLSFYHLKLHAHLHYASWQNLKRTLFQISPQLQLRTEKISPLKPGQPDDLLNLFVHLTIPTVQ